jgi:hypothetical protein
VALLFMHIQLAFELADDKSVLVKVSELNPVLLVKKLGLSLVKILLRIAFYRLRFLNANYE